MKPSYSLHLFVAAWIALLLQACALPFTGKVGDTGMSRKEFAHYVEDVFRFQNRMTSDVMMLTATDEGGNFAALLALEQRMQQVCAPLNEYVSREMDGLGAGLSLWRQVVKESLACDHAAHEVDALLRRCCRVRR